MQIADRILFDVFRPAMIRAVAKFRKPRGLPTPIPVGPRAPKPSATASAALPMEVDGLAPEVVVMRSAVGEEAEEPDGVLEEVAEEPDGVLEEAADEQPAGTPVSEEQEPAAEELLLSDAIVADLLDKFRPLLFMDGAQEQMQVC